MRRGLKHAPTRASLVSLNKKKISFILGIVVLLLTGLFVLFQTFFGRDLLLQPIVVSLENEKARFDFFLDENDVFGLIGVYDKVSNYMHTVDTTGSAWEVSFIENVAPYTETKIQSSDAMFVKSYTFAEDNGVQTLTMQWSNGIIGGDSFTVEQIYTLAAGDELAHMGLSVNGDNLADHSVYYVSPILYYAQLPVGSQSLFPLRRTWLVTDPQDISGFQQTSGSITGYGVETNQLAFGDLSVFPAGTESFLHYAYHDANGYHKAGRFQGDDNGYRIYLRVYGDKQKLPAESFTLPFDMVIGPVTGAYERDWYASTLLYKQWLTGQDFFPDLLVDRTDVPDYVKTIELIAAGIIYPSMTADEISDLFLGQRALYGVGPIIASLWGWNSQAADATDFYVPIAPVAAAIPVLNDQDVHVTAFVGGNYLLSVDQSYVNNPALASARRLTIDDQPIAGDLQPYSSPSYIFDSGSPVWQEHQLARYTDLAAFGFEGFYLDAPNTEPDYGNGYHGGGDFAVAGLRTMRSFLRDQARAINSEYIQWTEASLQDHLDVDFTLTEGSSGKGDLSAFGMNNGPDISNAVYVPANRVLQAGRVVDGAASDKLYGWGLADLQNQVMDYDSYIKQAAQGLSYGKVPSPSESRYLSIVTQPGGSVGNPGTVVPIGYSYDPSTWTQYSQGFFPEVIAFYQEVFGSLSDHLRFTRFGPAMLRLPQTDSPIDSETYYDLNPPIVNNLPRVPVSLWKDLGGAIGIVAINSQNTAQTVTVTIPFADYGLTPGIFYELYEIHEGITNFIIEYDTDFTQTIALEPYQTKTLVLIDSADDPDSDSFSSVREDTGVNFDNCPSVGNSGQEDTDGDGVGDACDCEPTNPQVSFCTVSICGDGVIENAEICDDGNTDSDDGCSATCTVETGWTCGGAPSVCTLIGTTGTTGSSGGSSGGGSGGSSGGGSSSVGTSGGSGVSSGSLDYACNDLIDNDNDGFIDFPLDDGCENGADTSEENVASVISSTNEDEEEELSLRGQDRIIDTLLFRIVMSILVLGIIVVGWVIVRQMRLRSVKPQPKPV